MAKTAKTTVVSQTYRQGQGLSITTKDGHVTLITSWYTNTDKPDTVRHTYGE